MAEFISPDIEEQAAALKRSALTLTNKAACAAKALAEMQAQRETLRTSIQSMIDQGALSADLLSWLDAELLSEAATTITSAEALRSAIEGA